MDGCMDDGWWIDGWIDRQMDRWVDRYQMCPTLNVGAIKYGSNSKEVH